MLHDNTAVKKVWSIQVFCKQQVFQIMTNQDKVLK